MRCEGLREQHGAPSPAQVGPDAGGWSGVVPWWWGRQGVERQHRGRIQGSSRAGSMHLGSCKYYSALRESFRGDSGFTYSSSSVSKEFDCYSSLASAHRSLHAIHRGSFA